MVEVKRTSDEELGQQVMQLFGRLKISEKMARTTNEDTSV